MTGRGRRREGADFERALAAALREVWPEARRGKQDRDGGDAPDVEGSPFWIECKARKDIRIGGAHDQAAAATDGRPPVVVSKQDRRPILATMAFGDWLRLAAAAERPFSGRPAAEPPGEPSATDSAHSGVSAHDRKERLTVLESFVDQLAGDELEVLCEVAHGLAIGRRSYGELVVGHDRRDFPDEALEEVRDALVYAGAALVRRRRQQANGGPR